jgi:hypothetical protein
VSGNDEELTPRQVADLADEIATTPTPARVTGKPLRSERDEQEHDDDVTPEQARDIADRIAGQGHI